MIKKRKRKIHYGRLAALILGAGLCITAIGGGAYYAYQKLMPKPEPPKQMDENGAVLADEKEPTTETSFTFTGVGDNLLHDRLYKSFEEKYGNRSYLLQYEDLVPYLDETDLNYINLETTIAGDQFGLSGYPTFNGPTEYFYALENAGFNWISAASNHTYDLGSEPVLAELEFARTNTPDLTVTGIHDSQEDADTPVVKEVNGVKVGLATFAFGMNSNIFPDEPYLIDIYRNPDYSINYELLDQRLDALNAVSDVQIVSMHWGNEYETIPDDEQRELANYLNSKGVEVVLGTHPHVIQPVEMIHGENQDTLVYYSLGNCLSGQDTNERVVGSMAQFKLDYDPETGKSTLSDIKFIPTVMLISPDKTDFKVTTFDKYTDEMAANHYVQTEMGWDMSKAWIEEYVKQVLGTPSDGIQIVLGDEIITANPDEQADNPDQAADPNQDPSNDQNGDPNQEAA